MGEVSIAPIAFGAEDKSASELGGAPPTAINVVVDSAGVVRRRPGIKAWVPFPADGASGSPVIGMRPFGQQLVYVTADRKIRAVSAVGGVVELSDPANTATWLDGGGRPVFVAGRKMLVIAGKGAMQKWTGTGFTARLTNTGAGGNPPDATSICAVAQRLVAMVNNNSGQVWWTGPLEAYENWDMATGGASFIQAAAKPDPLVAMLDNTNEVFAFGSETLQIFSPAATSIDDNDPYNLIDFAPSRTMNIGTLAPYSAIAVDDMFAMVDRLRRVVVTDGRTYDDVSRPVASLLRTAKGIEAAWGFRLKFGRFDAAVWVLPDEEYGLLYDFRAQRWCEWRAWREGPQPIQITSAYNWAEQGVFLVGLSDGSIAQLDDDVSTDLGDPIEVELTSGFEDHGTQAQKHCRTLMLTFKRGFAATAGSGHVRVSYRDNQGVWRVLRDIELSREPSPSLQIRSLGVYRTRQWKIRYTGSDELQLVSAQEEFETLGA